MEPRSPGHGIIQTTSSVRGKKNATAQKAKKEKTI
jgi:hypothetical protein